MNAAREFNVKQIVVGGGVSANKPLRDAFLAQTGISGQHPAFVALY